MAEGLANSLFSGKLQAFSAGTEVTSVHPLAKQVMLEVGIDISDHYSKHLNIYLDRGIDLVVTVCDSAKESCPVFYGAKRMIHKSFEDPSVEGTVEQFRKVRNQLREFLQDEFAKVVEQIGSGIVEEH